MKRSLIIRALLAVALTTTLSTVYAADGKALFEKNCVKCHGADGKGNTKTGQKFGVRDYSNPKTWESMKENAAVKAVKEGVKDKEGKQVMKPFEDLSDADAKAVVDYMKTLKK